MCLLISCTTAIAAKYPFKAQDISTWAVLTAVVTWFAVSMLLAYSGLAWLFSEHKDSPESALGLGLILLGTGSSDGSVPWYMLIFIIPNASFLVLICFSHGLLLQGLKGKPEITSASVLAVSQLHRKKAGRKSFVALLLVLLQYSPILITNICAMFLFFIMDNVVCIIIIWTLFFIPAGNVIVYVLLSKDFRCWINKISCLGTPSVHTAARIPKFSHMKLSIGHR